VPPVPPFRRPLVKSEHLAKASVWLELPTSSAGEMRPNRYANTRLLAVIRNTKYSYSSALRLCKEHCTLDCKIISKGMIPRSKVVDKGDVCASVILVMIRVLLVVIRVIREMLIVNMVMMVIRVMVVTI